MELFSIILLSFGFTGSPVTTASNLFEGEAKPRRWRGELYVCRIQADQLNLLVQPELKASCWCKEQHRPHAATPWLGATLFHQTLAKASEE